MAMVLPIFPAQGILDVTEPDQNILVKADKRVFGNNYGAVTNFEGYLVNPQDLNFKIFTPHYVARTLCRLPRWRNDIACPGMVTVAAHSYVVASCCVEMRLRLFYFVHDWSECITNDIPSPLLKMFPDLKAFCNELQEKIWDHYCPGWRQIITREQLALYHAIDANVGSFEWVTFQDIEPENHEMLHCTRHVKREMYDKFDERAFMQYFNDYKRIWDTEVVSLLKPENNPF